MPLLKKTVYTPEAAEAFIHKGSEALWYDFRDRVLIPQLRRGARVVLEQGDNRTVVRVATPTEVHTYNIRVT